MYEKRERERTSGRSVENERGGAGGGRREIVGEGEGGSGGCGWRGGGGLFHGAPA